MTTDTTLANMPADARLWVFGANRPIDPATRAALSTRLQEFLTGWHAHGAPVVGDAELLEDRFLIVAADERATGVSGCSTDSLFRILKAAEQDLSISFLDAGPVFYRDEANQIVAAERPEFRTMVREGTLDGDTIVFDTTVRTVGELRSGGWERPMRESWHARAFGLSS